MSVQKVLTGLLLLSVILLVAACVAQAPPAAAPAQEQAQEEVAAPGEAPQEEPAQVEQQVPISILVNDSPWFGGFEAAVEKYEEDTGNVVTLDVTPYNGMLEKGRNAVNAPESPYDLINIDTGWTVEFYDGGFLTPLDEIEPGYQMPPEVLTYDDSYFWNAEKQWRTSDGGKLMTFPPNGNIQLLFYRADLYEEAGLEPPETWDDLLTACQQLQDRPNLYGFVGRGERGNAIRFAWTPFMLGHGANFVRDPENGDYTVTINSPEARAALDVFLSLHRECGPPNAGSIGQGDMIQLMTTGKAANIVSVIAAWSQMDDPEKSVVIGKVNTVMLPKPVDGEHATTIGNWHFGVPKNLPDERKQAALAFAKWFLSYDAQYAFAEAGGVPVRSDIFESDLAEKPKFRWMSSYLDSMPYAHQVLGYKEGAQIEEIMGLRLNQALIGELSAAEALNLAAEDMLPVFEANGRNTGKLDPLPE